MSGIFISYRRDDSRGFAGRLADALDAAFGADKVFRDIDDIRPGEDFVTAINERLASVDVLLALIGPEWLEVGPDGRRRLDDPTDFVRVEIERALVAGKPVWPLLLGGAVMPAEAELPEALRPLVRHQAMTLSDAGWKDDVARLITALRPLLAVYPRSRRGWWAAAVLLCLLVGGALLWRLQAPLPAANQQTSQAASPFAGSWTARVPYDWGAEHDERFELQVEAGTLHGTASFLRLPRTIESGVVSGNERIEFTTYSESTDGSTTRTLTHRYRGRLNGETIRFVLESSGSPPVEFEARRAGP